MIAGKWWNDVIMGVMRDYVTLVSVGMVLCEHEKMSSLIIPGFSKSSNISLRKTNDRLET